MSSEFPEDIRRIVFGRTYLETLVLTMRFKEISSPDPDTLLRIMKILEDELCALVVSNESLSKDLLLTAEDVVSKLFPDLPKPVFSSCRISDAVSVWVRENYDHIIAEKGFLLPSSEYVRSVQEITRWITRTIQQAFLFRTGLLSISPQYFS
ncbi:MAG: hypothetical protein QXE68_07240 [Sulfolobales archaeon]